MDNGADGGSGRVRLWARLLSLLVPPALLLGLNMLPTAAQTSVAVVAGIILALAISYVAAVRFREFYRFSRHKSAVLAILLFVALPVAVLYCLILVLDVAGHFQP